MAILYTPFYQKSPLISANNAISASGDRIDCESGYLILTQLTADCSIMCCA